MEADVPHPLNGYKVPKLIQISAVHQPQPISQTSQIRAGEINSSIITNCKIYQLNS